MEKLLQQHHPKLIYTIPNFHNPTGTCLSSARRHQLIVLADRYNIPILEDDFVGDLRYEGRTQPALKALDPGGRVIHVSTFSKMLMPGLRVGYLWGNGPAWDSAYALIPWYLYQYRGDTRVLAEHYDRLKRYVDYLTRRSKNSIVDIGLGGLRCYSDEAQAPGKRLEIEIAFPEGGSAVALVEVVWDEALPEVARRCGRAQRAPA